MTKIWAASAMIVSFALSIFSQQTTPPVKPTPTPPADADVVKIQTNLIQLDVTVIDKKGDPVRDLTLDEIKVYENGKLQKITHLSFVPGAKTSPRTSEEKKAAAAAPVLPGVPLRADQVRRTLAIVVDDGGMSWKSAFFARKELLKYIEEQVFDGDLVAIIRTSGGIGALQHFTTDKRLLRAAVENVRFYPGQPGGWDIFGSSPTKEEDTMRAFRDEYYSFAGFSTLAYVIAGLNRMPGRKSIAFVSDGWMPPQRGQSTTQYERAQQNVVDFANRSSVVINTILASGVEFDGTSAFDNIANPFVGGGGGGWGSSSSSERLRPLRILGDDTGGRVIVNNNITNSIRRVFNDQSYYLVAYEPDEDTFDAKKRRFNKFEVKVSRPDVTVRHRNGFFGFTPELAAKVMPPETSPLLAALMSPFAESGVFVRMNAVFTTDDTRKAYLKTFVNVNSSDLTFNKQPDGNYKTSFDIVALTVDLRGWLLDERPKNYTLTLGEKEYQRIRDRGLVMTFLVPMPGPGGFQVRIAVRDVASGDIGSASQFVEIPDLKNKRLAISGLVLSSRNSVPDPSVNGEASDDSDALRDTSLRQFKPGSVLDVGYQIFNAKTNKDKTVDLSIKLKLYRDGKLISETDFVPVPDVNYEPGGVVSGQAAITVGKALLPGDYLFQLEVKDLVRKEDKRSSVVQFVQFDVVE